MAAAQKSKYQVLSDQIADLQRQLKESAKPELDAIKDALPDLLDATGESPFEVLEITDGEIKQELAHRAAAQNQTVAEFLGIVPQKQERKPRNQSGSTTMTPQQIKEAKIKEEYAGRTFKPKGEFANKKSYVIGTQGRFPAHIVALYDAGKLEEYLEQAPAVVTPDKQSA